MKEEFLAFMAEILEVEVESISMDTDFRKDIEEWSSMKGFMVICMIVEEYLVKIDIPDFVKCQKIGELYSKVIS